MENKRQSKEGDYARQLLRELIATDTHHKQNPQKDLSLRKIAKVTGLPRTTIYEMRQELEQNDKSDLGQLPLPISL